MGKNNPLKHYFTSLMAYHYSCLRSSKKLLYCNLMLVVMFSISGPIFEHRVKLDLQWQ